VFLPSIQLAADPNCVAGKAVDPIVTFPKDTGKRERAVTIIVSWPS
jgi:hypothetical protein